MKVRREKGFRDSALDIILVICVITFVGLIIT